MSPLDRPSAAFGLCLLCGILLLVIISFILLIVAVVAVIRAP